jgi:hypothetical protein
MRIKTKIKNIYYKLELKGEIINNKTFIKWSRKRIRNPKN